MSAELHYLGLLGSAELPDFSFLCRAEVGTKYYICTIWYFINMGDYINILISILIKVFVYDPNS